MKSHFPSHIAPVRNKPGNRAAQDWNYYSAYYAFFGFLLVNSLDPAVIGARMGVTVGSFVQQAFAYLAAGK